MTDESAHHISAEGLPALEAELHALETEGRRAIAERIVDVGGQAPNAPMAVQCGHER
jgi:hypothetical protein